MSGPRDTNDELAKPWYWVELKEKDALDPDRLTRIPDLSGDVHPIFAEERWSTADRESGGTALLQQSMLLASRILEAGIEHVAEFLPSDRLYEVPMSPRDENLNMMLQGDDRNNSGVPRLLPLRDYIGPDDLELARSELDDLASSITWQTDPLIYRRNGWNGICSQVPLQQPYQATELRPTHICESDDNLVKKNFTRRQLQIAIMSEYLDIIGSSEVDSEQHLRATFMAGVTMAHEIGHALFWHDFRAWTPDNSEMFVGDGCRRELGHSFLSFVFGNRVPEIVNWGCFQAYRSFKTPLFWSPQYRKGEARYLHKELKSVSTDYIERMLSQGSWEGLTDPQDLRDLLQSDNLHATSLEPDFYYASRDLGYLWRDVPGGGHRDPQYRAKSVFPVPTQEQLEAAEKWRIQTKAQLSSYEGESEDPARDDDDPVYQEPDVKRGLVQVMRPSRSYGNKQEWTTIEVKYHAAPREDGNNDSQSPSVSPSYLESLCTINAFTNWNYYEDGWKVAKEHDLGTWDTEWEAQARSTRAWSLPDQLDLAMMAKIREMRIAAAEKEFAGDNLLLLGLRELSMQFIANWHPTDLERYCSAKHIAIRQGTLGGRLRKTVLSSFQRGLDALKSQLGGVELPQVVKVLISSAAWPEQSVQYHLRKNAIQRSMVPLQNRTLVMKSLAESARHALPRPRNYRVNGDGDRIYAFKVKMMSTVGLEIEHQLRTKIEDYPHEIVTSSLFFEELRDPVLRDQPLARNGLFRDWTDLRYEQQVIRTYRKGDGPRYPYAMKPPDVRLAQELTRVIEPLERAKRIRTSPRPVSGVRPPPTTVAPTAHAEHLARLATIQEALQQLTETQSAVVVDLNAEDDIAFDELNTDLYSEN
ncbi:hypothetical protein PVAG01_01907 [Phlyctema vagabunda]|uniref:Uncharacterized protein n=1 Tax=Phlyctema vagabunda TaxID=108571 RepID=A0ABR4PYD9_9HELO